VEEKLHGTPTIQTKMLKNDNALERIIWVASVDATRTRAESAKGKGGTMVGAKEIVSCKKKANIR
jgi:hypothetical protein